MFEIINPKKDVETQISGVEGHELGDVKLAQRCADKLNEHYPDHLWAVHINDEDLGGVLIIRNLAVSFKYGYVLKLSRIYADPNLYCVVTAGGEVLERSKMIRGRWDGQEATHIDGVKPQHQPFVNGRVF